MTLNHQFNKNDAVADPRFGAGLLTAPASWRPSVNSRARSGDRRTTNLDRRTTNFTTQAGTPVLPNSRLPLPASRRASALARPLAGFTLIELLVVMLVIMILAGLMLKMGAYIRVSALQNQAQSEMNAIAGAVRSYAADHGYALPPAPLYQALLMGPKKYLDWPAARILPGSGTGLLDPWGGVYTYEAGRGDIWSGGPAVGGNMFKTGDMGIKLTTSGAPIGQNVIRWYSLIESSNMPDTQHF